MASFPLRRYFTYAVLMIRSNSIVLWGLGFIGLCSAAALLLKGTGAYWPLNILAITLSIAVTPIFYGIYFELIEDTYTSITAIARTYVLNYIWLLMRMYVPAVFVASLPLLVIPSDRAGGYLETILIFFSLLYLYVIPTYYITGKQYGAITAGVRFLLANLSRSAPLILAVLLLETAMLLLQHGRIGLAGQNSIGFALLDFIIYVGASIIDFVIFIILIFILKNPDEKDETTLSPDN
jgi:hypothetical protein